MRCRSSPARDALEAKLEDDLRPDLSNVRDNQRVQNVVRAIATEVAAAGYLTPVMEYRVQFANDWSEKNGDEVASEVMPLEEAQQFIADHPETEYVILERTAGVEPSIWSVYAPGRGAASTGAPKRYPR